MSDVVWDDEQAAPGVVWDDAAAPRPTAPPAPLKVGAGETFLNKAVDAIPAGRLLTNALSALAMKALGPKPGVRFGPAALAAGAQQPQAPSLMDEYRGARDDFAARTAQGSADHPWASGLGTAAGTGLSLLAPLPKVGKIGTGAGGRVLSNALTAGGYGTLNGALNSRGDLTRGDVGQVLGDAVGIGGLKQAAHDFGEGNYGHALLDVAGAGGIGGALTGGALGGALEGGRAVAGPLSRSVRNLAINQGRRALTNGADTLSSRAALPDANVEEAIRSKAIQAFGTTKGAAGRLGDLTEQVGDQYGQIVAGLEAKGVAGPDARKVADQLLSKGAALERHTMNDALPREYLDRADQLLGKAGPNGELRLGQAEDLKRSVQDLARFGKVEDTPLNVVRKNIASVMRQANEDAIAQAAQAAPADAQLQSLASDFAPVKQRLGNLYGAQAAAERGAARGAQRNALGQADKLMALAGIATHNPLAVGVSGVSHLLGGRLPSTVASGGLALSDLLRVAPNASPVSGKAYELLANALRGPQPMMSPGLAQNDEAAQQLALAEAMRQGAGR